MLAITLYLVVGFVALYGAGLVVLNGLWLLRGERFAPARLSSANVHPAGTRTARASRGFTLVELLVVIGVIAILIGLLMPALSAARRSAQHVRLCAGLREVMMGYTRYHLDHKGALLLGYTPTEVNGAAVTVQDARSGHVYDWLVADRYPWRLAPWVENLWPIMHIHAEVPPLPEASDSPEDAQDKAYTLSVYPSFGINAVYVGGHKDFEGFSGPNNRPNTGKHVIFRANEARRPSELIVFAENAGRNFPGIPADGGLSYLTPPRAKGLRWWVENEEFILTTGKVTAIPKGRFGKRAAVAFFDGHVESLLPSELEDMRLWSPRATTTDYDYSP